MREQAGKGGLCRLGATGSERACALAETVQSWAGAGDGVIAGWGYACSARMIWRAGGVTRGGLPTEAGFYLLHSSHIQLAILASERPRLSAIY